MTQIVNVQHYQPKPRPVDAVHWEGSAIEAAPFINWVLAYGGTARYHERLADGLDEHIDVDTYHGTTHALPGDWIVKDMWDQFTVMDDITFNAAYERVNP